MTPSTVIEDLGGNSAVAAELGLDDTTVSTWRRRGIPPGRWTALAGLAERKGMDWITLDVLAAIRAPSPAEVRA